MQGKHYLEIERGYPIVEYKKSELTYFAKVCARGAEQMIIGLCMAEEIAHSGLGEELINYNDDELLLEVSKRYAKYAQTETDFSIENSATQDFQSLINKIVVCCDEHDWFRK